MRSTASRVYLERPTLRRERDYLDACHRSRALHRGLVIAATTSIQYLDYLRRTRRDTQESFFIVDATTDDLVGVVNINDIASSGELPSGRLGYYAFVPYAGTGRMREGIEQVIRLAFDRLGLGLVEAQIQPVNGRSLALARGLGFRPEGQRCCLKIGARWLAHEGWVLRLAAWRAVESPALRSSVFEWQRGRVDRLAQHEGRVDADHSFDSRDLRQ
jgi:ribosomal-protein-alanine N-acetyltransferase